MSAVAETAVRAAVFFVWLVVLARLMGKRQIGQLTFFDYVAGITIGSIAGTTVTMLAPVWVGLTGLTTFSILTIVMAVATRASRSFARLVNGEPTAVVHQGQIVRDHLRKVGMTTSELASLLRQAEAFSLADVEFAILEPSGKLSVKKKSPSGSQSKGAWESAGWLESRDESETSGQAKTPGQEAGGQVMH